jgi:hypothetical protein
MAESNEPKKETVRINLPSRSPGTGPTEDRDTARIDLPAESPRESSQAPAAPAARSAPPLARSPLPPLPSEAVAPPRRIVPPPPMPVSTPKPPGVPAPAPRRFPAPPPPVSASVPPPSPVSKTPAPQVPVAAPGAQPKKETSRLDTALEPKKETSRINLVPDQGTKSVGMSKTQPLVTVTATPVSPPPAPVRVAAEPASIITSIPVGLCWALVAISAAILIIEIWTYIS